MSLILDALRKSEAERKRGQAPGLHSAGGRLRQRERAWMPLAGAAAVLALAGGGAWWLWGGSADERSSASEVAAAPGDVGGNPATPDVAATGASGAEPPAPTGSLTTTPLPERESQPVAATEVHLQPANMGGAAANVQSTAMSGGGEWPAPALAAPATGAAQPLAAAPVPAMPVPAPEAVPAPPPAPVVEANVVTADPATVPTAPATPVGEPERFNTRVLGGLEATSTATAMPPGEALQPANPALPTIYELDYAVRRELPKMQISMHVYNRDPSRSFALVNGKRYQAGGEAIDGKVILVEVLPDGLVCEFNGQRFLLPRQ